MEERNADLELALKVQEAFKSSLIKDFRPKLLEEADGLVKRWQKSSILQKKSPIELEKALAIMDLWNKAPSRMREAKPKGLMDALEIVQSWEKCSGLRGKTPKDLDGALVLVAEWKKTPALKYHTPVNIENSFKRIKEWERNPASKKEGNGKLAAEYALQDAWSKSSILRKASPNDLTVASKLVDAQKGVSLLNGKSIKELERVFTLVTLWKKHRGLSVFTPQEILQAQEAAGEWKKIFGNYTPEELSKAIKMVDYWKRHPVLKTRTPAQMQRDLELVAEYQKKEEKAELDFFEALIMGVSNLDTSVGNYVDNLYTAVTNPVQTLDGIRKIILGYTDQLNGEDSEYREYSDAVSAYFTGRFRSWAGFKQALADDPFGLASDISFIFTFGSLGLRAGALAAKVGAKAVPAGGQLAKAASAGAGKTLDKTAKAAAKAGDYTDVLYWGVKAGGAVASSIKIPPEFNALAARIAARIDAYGSGVDSGARTILGIMGTSNSIIPHDKK